ncbi:MAG: HD domain-containing protein [Candidatus Omnitrophica bacterium]|nr:HD domain-containing protein [Candidatus Omnitrophota bacterium]
MSEQEYEKLKENFLQILKALSSLIDLRNGYEINHSENVAKYAVLTAKELGLPDDQIEDINYAALLHDIGKLEIKEGLLTKPTTLSDLEWNLVISYPGRSARAISSVEILKRCVPLILYHRHWFKNGTKSYPRGTEGEEIPLGAYIISAAEAYEAMISDRPYRKAIPKELVISEIKKKAGTQFYPKVVDAFLRVLEKETKE